MGPPGVDTAHQKDGVITRARHARNLEEARANLEAQRARDAHLTLQEKTAEETKKAKVLQKEIEELKAMLEEKQAELAKVNNDRSHLEK
jgi:predicted nuclease with TOPRIM domain